MHTRTTSTRPLRRQFGALLGAAVLSLTLLPLGAQAQSREATQAPQVRLNTSMGDIVLELDPVRAPQTVANFLQYVRERHYDGTIFHRVMSDFMIQGGGFNAQMQQKPTRAPIPLEALNGLRNDRGTVAMARTQNPHSATAQFFINVVDNPNLNAPRPDGHGYAVFGRVVAGMEVVDRIRGVAVGNQSGHQNVPRTAVTILKATLEP
ncbi:peptidylprolyl isomerase [Hydrogenophaga sp.]|uniref:peptidylprolyl isomerase n=1 Tax=Hydrogenophaga sp. TaxID=1904254 RepID=UPI0019906363|nr:peptidylprolyl isomerase [Hydrogenophaga sp.]MBD3893984.1 peptidyl-prolyl cis-trans isomerase [Hydrogenophaga sp.]